MQIKVKRVGATPNEFLQDIQLRFISVENGLKKLGEETAMHMRENVRLNKRRRGSQGKLESTIKCHIEGSGKSIRIGIGLISFLNQYAPYWKFVDSGVSQTGMTIPGRGKSVGGYFDNGMPPDSRFSGTGVGRGSFTRQNNTYVMQAKNPIRPLNYIDKTLSWLSVVFKIHFYNYTRTSIIHTK